MAQELAGIATDEQTRGGTEGDLASMMTQDQKELFVFSDAKPFIDALIDEWKEEIDASADRRLARFVDLDIDDLRAKGKIKPDEVFIPDMVIEQNIKREQPAFLGFLNKSRRLAIFTVKDDPSIDTQRLEREFTKGLRYTRWLKDHLRTIDGFLLHGTDALEVVYDETKPLHVGYEHIGHDRLLFNTEIDDIQDSERVLRVYTLSSVALRRMTKTAKFDRIQVDIILEKDKSSKVQAKKYTLYKVFFKYENIVYVGWYSRDSGVTDWVRRPEKLFIGISVLAKPPEVAPGVKQVTGTTLPDQGGQMGQQQSGLAIPSLPTAEVEPTWQPIDVDMYPIFLFNYMDNEESKLTACPGREFLDAPKQEAKSAIITGFINSLLRASNVYGSPDSNDIAEGAMRQLDVKLQHGAIYNKKINFFQMDYPPVEILAGLNMIDTRDAQQAGQTDYAVMNRKDSRKSATELMQAGEDADLIKSVPLSSYSETLRECLTFTWKIVQSQALQDKIPLLRTQVQVPTKVVDPMTGLPAEGPPTTETMNDYAMIEQEFEIGSAGDVDFIERTEKIQKMMQAWPVVQNTGARLEFLKDLIILLFPDKGEFYAQKIQEGDPALALVAQLATYLSGALQPEEFSALAPNEQQQLIATEQAVQQLTGQPIKFIPNVPQQQNQQKQLTAGAQQ